MFKDLPRLRLLKWFGGAVLAIILIAWSYLFHFPQYSTFLIYVEEKAVFLGGLIFLSFLGFYLIFIPFESLVQRLDQLNYYLQRIQRLGIKLQESDNKKQLFNRIKKQVAEELPYEECALYNYVPEDENLKLEFGPSRGLKTINDAKILDLLQSNQTRFWEEEEPFTAWGWEPVVIQPVRGLGADQYLLVLKVEKFSDRATLHRLLAHRFGERINEALRQYSLRKREEKEQERLTRKVEKATEELKQQQEFLSSILNSLDEGLVVTNKSREVNLVNPRAQELLELPEKDWQAYDYNEITGRLPEEIFKKQDAQSARLVETDGRFFEYEWQPVEETEFRILLLQDRTRREKLQRRLQINETLELLGEMASSVVHELRNPLGGMEMYIGLLKRKADKEELQKPVSKISDALQSIQRITEGLLNFTKTGEPSFESVKPNQLIKNVIEHCRPRFEENEIEVDNLLPELKEIKGDVEQLRNVFVNLIQNAIEAQSSGGKIEIRGKNLVEEIKISVRDYGGGISEEEQEEAFNRFFSTKEEGTGLGLAISKRLVEVHSGEIKVESTAGEGSTFSVVLPQSPVELPGGEASREQ